MSADFGVLVGSFARVEPEPSENFGRFWHTVVFVNSEIGDERGTFGCAVDAGKPNTALVQLLTIRGDFENHSFFTALGRLQQDRFYGFDDLSALGWGPEVIPNYARGWLGSIATSSADWQLKTGFETGDYLRSLLTAPGTEKLYVFGTRSRARLTGLSGLHEVHQNQGNLNPEFVNSPGLDGCIVVRHAPGQGQQRWTVFLSKFVNQVIRTPIDAQGNPRTPWWPALPAFRLGLVGFGVDPVLLGGVRDTLAAMPAPSRPLNYDLDLALGGQELINIRTAAEADALLAQVTSLSTTRPLDGLVMLSGSEVAEPVARTLGAGLNALGKKAAAVFLWTLPDAQGRGGLLGSQAIAAYLSNRPYSMQQTSAPRDSGMERQVARLVGLARADRAQRNTSASAPLTLDPGAGDEPTAHDQALAGVSDRLPLASWCLGEILAVDERTATALVRRAEGSPGNLGAEEFANTLGQVLLLTVRPVRDKPTQPEFLALLCFAIEPLMKLPAGIVQVGLGILGFTGVDRAASDLGRAVVGNGWSRHFLYAGFKVAPDTVQRALGGLRGSVRLIPEEEPRRG